MIREIVTIDEELCDGCGMCVPACQEGALKIVDGKAKLVGDNLCDGLGACLGHCPRGAIKIERREADVFDEAAVAAQTRGAGISTCPSARPHTNGHGGGCPGSRLAQFFRDAEEASEERGGGEQRSELRHWPVKLRLLPAKAPVLQGAKLLIAADCVPAAYAGFHSELLRGRAVVLACPKLDDTTGYLEKLEAMFRENDLAEIVVARMEVPCCGGLATLTRTAYERSGCTAPMREVVLSVEGERRVRP